MTRPALETPTTIKMRPSLPGAILAELYLPGKFSIGTFATACGVSRKHISAIIHGRARITPKMAMRIAVALGTTPQYWLNLQNAVDLHDATGFLTRPSP